VAYKIVRRGGGQILEGAHDDQSPNEDSATTTFARFEDLVRKLVSVPKEELDKKLDEDERKKKEKKEKQPEEA
jgi:hypothetical protein